ncbi:MAG: aspartate aminotransferase family protein [Solirubrobacteraceae bacterium]
MDGAQLAQAARDHMLLHFTDMEAFARSPLVLARGEGCHVFDIGGKRYIDGLSGLYCTQVGHSYGDEIGRAAHAQMCELPYTSNWTIAHPRSIELATRIAQLAPSGLERVFFTSGGSEAVEAAWKLARQYHAARGEPQRRKAIARKIAYHGTTLGALSFTGLGDCRAPFEPLAVPTRFVSATDSYRHPLAGDERAFCRALLDEIEEVIEFEHADTIAMLIAEPVQNAGGCFVAPDGYWAGLRELCDRHGILLCSDEVICAWGRIGTWFGCQRLDYVPDLLTFAKGLTSAHFAMGGVLLSDKVAEPFVQGKMYMHGVTFGGHPVGSAIALKNIEIIEREGLLHNVIANEPLLRDRLTAMLQLEIVGDVRGMGHFWALELVRDKDHKSSFTTEETKWLLRDFLSARLLERGLLVRLDDRDDPVVLLAPPLVADRAVLSEMCEILALTLEEAGAALREAAPVAS